MRIANLATMDSTFTYCVFLYVTRLHTGLVYLIIIKRFTLLIRLVYYCNQDVFILLIGLCH